MKVTVIAAKPFGPNLKVVLRFIDDSVTPNILSPEREYMLSFKTGLTVSEGKAWLKEKIAEYKAERDTDVRVAAFVGNTYDESVL